MQQDGESETFKFESGVEKVKEFKKHFADPSSWHSDLNVKLFDAQMIKSR